ncbi:MAG: GIY-YIG nuclease family protein, partial [Caulobacteraceae bacterium]
EEIATRERCEDFAAFEPLFEAVRKDLEAGVREARRFGENAAIKQGEFFVLGGQIAYVAAVPEALGAAHGHVQGRLRVIYDNGTRSDPLLRSMQRALYKDEAGRRITDPLAGPLFGGVAEDGDLESGTLYVLRSQSDHPDIAARRDLVHKIGVTGGSVQARVAGAANEATYLLSDVEIVATYRLFNINRAKLEAIIHRVFAAARLDLTIPDRFGRPVQPREWFLAPLPVIDEVVEHIRDGSIAGLEYDPASASLRRAAP